MDRATHPHPRPPASINWISMSLTFIFTQQPIFPFQIRPKRFLLQMENKRQSGSFPSELFGTKEQSTTDVFASIFPPSKGAGNNSTASRASGSTSTSRDDMDKNGRQPCDMSSSIYYGGRESYSQPKTANGSGSYTTKDAGEDDPTGASRGNWWQGSLYY